MLAKSKAEGNPVQVPMMEKIHGKGNLKRHNATGSNKSVHWLADDLTVADFQNAHPCRKVMQNAWAARKESKEQRLGRVSRTSGTTHKRGHCTKSLYKNQGAHADVHTTNFFKGYSPIDESSTSKPKSIIKSKERMYIVDRGASLHVMGASCAPQETAKPYEQTNNDFEVQTASGIVRSAQEARVYIQEFGTHFYVKLVEDSLSALYLGRLCVLQRTTKS